MVPSHSSNASSSLMSSKWAQRILAFVLVPVLVILALILPPIKLAVRLFHLDSPLVTAAAGGTVPAPDGAQLKVPAGAVAKNLRMRLDALPIASLNQLKSSDPAATALKSLPGNVMVRGALYRFTTFGAGPSGGSLHLPLPADLASRETIDLMTWDGKVWHWAPSQGTPDGTALDSQIEGLPSLVVMVQSQPQAPRIGVEATDAKAISGTLGVDLATVSVGGVTLAADGSLAGQPPAPSALEGLNSQKALLSISNGVGGVVRSDLVANIVTNEATRQAHVQKIADLVGSSSFAGVEIAYSGLDTGVSSEYSAFIQELAQALHAQNKILAVRVDAPRAAGATWATAGYDWQAIGKAADLVRIPALAEPAAYVANGAMDQLLTYAVGQVDRRKIDLALSALAHDSSEAGERAITYGEALALLVPSLQTSDADKMLLPGESITVSTADEKQSPVQLDSESQVYSFSYQDKEGREHKVRLENAASIARKLQYVSRYALGGTSLEEVLNKTSDRNIAQVVRNLKQNIAPPAPKFAFVWTVQDEAGKTLAQKVSALDTRNLSWTAPNNPGNYVIRAALSDDGGQTNVVAGAELAVQVPTPTFTPSPTPTNTPSPTPTEKPTNTPTPKPTEAPATAKPTAAAAAPVVAAGSTGGFFGYGIQADLMSDGDHNRIFGHINGMGFNWVKQQVEWFRYNPAPGQYDWGGLDRIVDGAAAHGVNVLFSVVKAPGWARPAGDTDQGPPADPNTYGTFMREMAARYKGRVKAYEIWNEQNLYYEWGGRGGKLNAGRYIELLKAAYNAVKSVDPGAVVVSGALTPTGVNDGDIAIDDRAYLEQMYQAGLARYCDAVGAHPSGYNNPPDADWRTWSDPSTPRCKGHPSWFFRGTMESYRNIMLKYGDGGKRIWPTEFGWASVEGLGVQPARGYEYAADNSEGEQAQFIVRAYQMGRAWGWVGPMFLWNLNFAPVSGNADEKAAFGIVRGDWSPRAAYAALRDMAK